MRKKQSRDEGGGANWMDTYGDLVTLLLCFFVLLYSFSTIDAEKWQQLVMSFRGAGSGVMNNDDKIGIEDPNDIVIPVETTLNDPNAGGDSTSPPEAPSITPAPTPVPTATPSPAPTVTPKPTRKPQPTKAPTATPVPAYVTGMKELTGSIANLLTDAGLSSVVSIEKTNTSVRIRLIASVIFEPGSDQLTPKAATLLQEVSALISPYAAIITSMHTEGHTDSVTAIDEDMSSKWDLASRRATRVLEMLLENSGVSSKVAYTQGYGDQRPIAGNDTPEGRDQNNRVDVVISSKP